MSEWRVTEIDTDTIEASLGSTSVLTSSSSPTIVMGESLLTASAVGDVLPSAHQSNTQSNRRLRRNLIQADRFGPLERFLDLGRQLQLQQTQIAQHQHQLANSQQQQQLQQQRERSNSHLRNKIVFALSCRFCQSGLCKRAMRAILLADTKVELYSTDIPPDSHALATGEEDRVTQGCLCRIRDTLCRGCGNVLGYHVSQPCERCLSARNNGHFWMFYSEQVNPKERIDRQTGKQLVWSQLSPMLADDLNGDDEFGLIGGYEHYKR